MIKKGRSLFISPHLDDAIFSSFGLIVDKIKKKEKVIIANIFSGVPDYNKLSSFALSLVDNGDVKNRIDENSKIINSISAINLNLNFLDAIFRSDNQGDFYYQSWSKIFYPDDNQIILESALMAMIEEKIISVISSNNITDIYFPLSIGGHVDHVLLNIIGNKLSNSSLKVVVYYYEDSPYANNSDDFYNLLLCYKIAKIIKVDIEDKLKNCLEYEQGLKIGDSNTLMKIKKHATSIIPNLDFFERVWQLK